MAGIGNINLKVLLYDADFYALQSINGYLAWDRRTRVTYMSEKLDDVWHYLKRQPLAELPDLVVLDVDHLNGPEGLRSTVLRLREYVTDIRIICMTRDPQASLVEMAAEMQANAFLVKGEVRFQIAWAIVHSLYHDFVISQGVAKACEHLFNSRIFHASILPESREYPELTERIKQALRLCVVEGMPAHLAADEMGISLHTIRGYIKEGYRILESYDDTEYPVDMTPQERAFMRLTALAQHENEDDAAE
jgi:DNA-binding NarL/FixJ family response regulator